MAKLTQADVRTKADEWAVLNTKIAAAETKRNEAMEPLIQEHNDRLKPILAKHDPKIDKLRAERAELETEIYGFLEKAGKPVSLVGELAVAETYNKEGSRVVDVEKFFKTTKEKTAEFWACLTVAVAKAEKYLGKTEVDRISAKGTKLVAQLKMK